MRRISIVGTSCSGKTTLARALAVRLGLPCVELDTLFWGPRWTPVPDDVFLDRVARALDGEAWVVDGGYAKLDQLKLGRADTVIWLDYPMRTVLARWARRTVRRIRSQEEFWPGTGNRESLRNALRRDGLLAWILTTHRRRRESMEARMRAWPGLHWIRLRSPAEADQWLTSVPLVVGGGTAAPLGASSIGQNDA
jgi:adenylate kinase family enzyme